MVATIFMTLYMLVIIAIMIFLLRMLYRFVVAIETIASKFKGGITIKKEEAP